MDNLVLIGMPGVGKSTIGVVLAKILGYRFIDADILIQEQENRLLKDIINEDGIDGFIKIENRVNSQINVDKAIIATGGSVVYGEEAMKHLKSIGRIIYLKLDYDSINGRLDNIKGRGVVLREGQSLKDIYDERISLYESYADIVIEEKGLNVEETIEQIIKNI